MENSITKSAKEISKRQKITVLLTLGAILLILVLFVSAGGKKQEDDISRIINNSKNKIILQDSSKGIKAEDRWLYEAQNKFDDVDKFMKRSQQDSTGLESRLDNIEQQYQENLEDQFQLIDNQSSEIEQLKTRISQFQDKQNLSFKNNNGVNQESAGGLVQIAQTIGSFELDLEQKSTKGLFNVNDYVPAGAYAKSKLVLGVDASVGISTQSDPPPILIRVLGPAISSIYDKETQKTDITGCLITGAAVGDLSSEKVFVKLVKMTCAKGENIGIEIPVKGYVAAQGKSGIRGDVVSREGDLVAKTFLAGLVSGFGQGLSEKVAPPLNFSNGLTTQGSMSNGDIAKQGFGKGIATSSDKLSDIFVNKIEQYQPVISIPSGIDIEVVFVEGFDFNPKNEKTQK
jgi:conjugal transfer pilus assembly protein TraB